MMSVRNSKTHSWIFDNFYIAEDIIKRGKFRAKDVGASPHDMFRLSRDCSIEPVKFSSRGNTWRMNSKFEKCYEIVTFQRNIRRYPILNIIKMNPGKTAKELEVLSGYSHRHVSRILKTLKEKEMIKIDILPDGHSYSVRAAI